MAGKDIKFGHDKRPVTTYTNSEQELYNYQTGAPLVDDSGQKLVTEVDEYFLNDATAERSTSVAFDGSPSSVYIIDKHSFVGLHTARYGVDLDVYVGSASTVFVLERTGSLVGISKTTVLQSSGYNITIAGHPGISTLSDGNVEVKTTYDLGGGERNRIYFDDSVGIQTVVGIKLGDKITGLNIPDGTFVSRIDLGRLIVSNDINADTSSRIRIRRTEEVNYKADNVIKVAEVFQDSSEVSSTLLGVDRAETQLSLFSNVSSYGLDETEFESYAVRIGGYTFDKWERRSNIRYGNRFGQKVAENTMESAITLEAFPVPYAFPFGTKFQKLSGFYQEDLYRQYKNFVTFGNLLYQHFCENCNNGNPGAGWANGWGTDWANKFLNPSFCRVVGDDVQYPVGVTTSFEKVDTWTDTWRDIKDKQLKSPDGNVFDDSVIEETIGTIGSLYKTSTTRPGYSESDRRYGAIQSRRVFRYQPGRISGFTFGVKTSDEPVAGYRIEWGISNPTDQYMFIVYGGQVSIRRRSTTKLDTTAIARSNLDPLDTNVNIDGIFYNTIQPQIVDGDPFGDEKDFYTLDIPRDKWNGDRLNGNGPSGYQLQMDRVTMWKIEFGWYGAIGARFYAYVPVESGEARWVVLHTLVIENSLEQPCLQDSYFRLKYVLDVENTSNMRNPAFIYKYGASYYVDGGDEGTQNVYSINSGIKSTYTGVQKPIIGITPKTTMVSSDGTEIVNKKMIIPKEINITSDSLTQVQVVSVKGGPQFAHAYTPGVASTITGRDVLATFDGLNVISGLSTLGHYFYETDKGAKLVAPGIFNYYIKDVSGAIDGTGPKRNGYSPYNSVTVEGYGPSVQSYPGKGGDRTIAGTEVIDNVTGLTTTTQTGGDTFPYPIRLSNYETEFASDFQFTGSKIEVQFLNPIPQDSYAHYADFMIGITDKVPVISAPDRLNEWQGVSWTQPDGTVGSGNTTILPKDRVLYGEYSHDYATLDENGVETGENVPGHHQINWRMQLDNRIPDPLGSGSGKPSLVIFEVKDPLEIAEISYSNGNPDPAISLPGHFLVKNPANSKFPTAVNEFDGGEVAISISNVKTAIGVHFVGTIRSWTDGDNNVTQYIEIDDNTNIPATGTFSIFIRPVQLTATKVPTQQKLYNFEPWPLYLTGKLSDNSAINAITVKETVGDFARTITPRFYVKGNIIVDNSSNNAGILGEAPPHYEEVDRLSSALYDIQDEQTLRPGLVRDTFYIGANETQTIEMGKIFNVDRDSIVPDNLNIESTFFVAEKIDDGSSGTVQATLIYTEQ